MTKKINYCFASVPEEGDVDQWRFAKLVENESGYYPLGKSNPNDPTEKDKFVGSKKYIDLIAKEWNKKLDISEKRVSEIYLSTFDFN